MGVNPSVPTEPAVRAGSLPVRSARRDAIPPSLQSPHGGPVQARMALHHRFAARMAVNPTFTRRLISYQGNKGTPGLRWFRYKEGFSAQLIRRLLNPVQAHCVLDPFAGIGTAPLTACGLGRQGVGIEIMPIGILAAQGIAALARWQDRHRFACAARDLVRHAERKQDAPEVYRFRHVPITRHAFPLPTEEAIARANAFIAERADPLLAPVLRLACMSVLETVSFTRKDGQYLRWDHRSGRSLRAKMEKGPIPSFADALACRLAEMERDMAALPALFGAARPTLIAGSCLERLRLLETDSCDAVITSPPYANRYDYTRTYALELAYLNYDQDEFRTLRQALLSATVENKSKRTWLTTLYRNAALLQDAFAAYDAAMALHEPLAILRACRAELSNPHVIRLVENYFLESAVVIAELGRVLRPGGTVFMVNDNVQYHGEHIPVDLILSSFAERLGFRCRRIWILPRGKGNASQQMGRFGRRELRKCVYHWERAG